MPLYFFYCWSSESQYIFGQSAAALCWGQLVIWEGDSHGYFLCTENWILMTSHKQWYLYNSHHVPSEAFGLFFLSSPTSPTPSLQACRDHCGSQGCSWVMVAQRRKRFFIPHRGGWHQRPSGGLDRTKKCATTAGSSGKHLSDSLGGTSEILSQSNSMCCGREREGETN